MDVLSIYWNSVLAQMQRRIARIPVARHTAADIAAFERQRRDVSGPRYVPASGRWVAVGRP